MKHLRILRKITITTGFNKFTASFVSYLLIASGILYFVEPQLHSYGDSLWFAFITATTVGYGDIVATTVLGTIVCVTLTLYGLIFFGCLSGVIVNYYSELNRKR